MKLTEKASTLKREKTFTQKILLLCPKFMTKVEKKDTVTTEVQQKISNSFPLFRPMKCSETNTKMPHRPMEHTSKILKQPRIMILLHQMPKGTPLKTRLKGIALTYPSMTYHRKTMISAKIRSKWKWITKKRRETFCKSKFLSLPKTCSRRPRVKQVLKMKTFRTVYKESKKD
jgi:hypothetical protein